MFNSIINLIVKRTNAELPGLRAQQKMAPTVRYLGKNNDGNVKNAKKSAVLILLFPSKNKINTVLIKRNTDNSVHSGQISFPGGKYEDSDDSLIYTAIREANEEIGIEPSQVNVIKQLTSLYVPASNFIIYPILGYLNNSPCFHPNPDEVEKVIELEINELLSPDSKGLSYLSFDKLRITAPYYKANNLKIWGATAMILSEVLELFEDIKIKDL